MLVQDKDFELELPSEWRRVERDDGFEWQRDDGSQIIITTYALKPGARPAEVLERFVELRRQAHRHIDPAGTLAPVVRDDHPDRLVATFTTAAGDAGIECFVAVVISVEPLLDLHTLVSFAYTGGRADDGRAAFAGLRFRPYADALRRAQASSGIDLARLYPYVTPRSYLDAGTEQQEIRALDHGLVLLLAEDNDGVCRILDRGALEDEGLDVDRALERAVSNLEAALKRRDIPIARFDGSGGLIRFGDHWLAASCIVLPGLRDFVSSQLGTDDIYAAIPHRDVLLCFPAGDVKTVDATRSAIRDAEADGRKPLTWELFRLPVTT